jgi:hypothetical protein
MSSDDAYVELDPRLADTWETELDGYLLNLQDAIRSGAPITRFVDELVDEIKEATRRGLFIQTDVALGKWGFHQWIRDQAGRGDCVGDLARDYVQDLDDGATKAQTPDQLRSRLLDAGADIAALDALTVASDEYDNIPRKES